MREYSSYVPAEIVDFYDFRSLEWPFNEFFFLERFSRQLWTSISWTNLIWCNGIGNEKLRQESCVSPELIKFRDFLFLLENNNQDEKLTVINYFNRLDQSLHKKKNIKTPDRGGDEKQARKKTIVSTIHSHFCKFFGGKGKNRLKLLCSTFRGPKPSKSKHSLQDWRHGIHP